MFNTAQILEENRTLKAKNVAAIQHINALEIKLHRVNKALVISEKTTEALNVKLDSLLEHIKLVNQPGIITYEVTGKAKNHPKRQPLPDHLPWIETIIDIDDADKVCECGCQRVQMGQEVSEELVVIPAKVVVKQTIRPKYICKNKVCENERIYLSLLAPRLLPKTNASPSLVADIITKKYVNHLPLYRQEKIWGRLKIILKCNTICGWLMMVADKYEPLYQLLNDFVLGTDILHADETTVQVLKEAGRSAHQKSYIWAYKGVLPGQQAVVFEYQETRQNKHPIKFLKTANGYIVTDGYDWIDKLDNLIRLYCMAHARRPFAELAKLVKTRGKSHEILEYFAKLYAVEKKAKEDKLSDSGRFILRLTESKPVLDNLFIFLKTIKTPPKGKAINYILSRESAFYRYLYDGRLPIDNNELENQIRPLALGRKNWLYLGSPRGTKAACIFYSLIQTAKINNIEPQAYLTAVFEKLPYCKTSFDFEELLPWDLERR